MSNYCEYKISQYNFFMKGENGTMCVCNEQWGTDGYTLWEGYYNGPYFPNREHFLLPAQSKEKQIHAPVCRMLGPVPVYCYYESWENLNL